MSGRPSGCRARPFTPVVRERGPGPRQRRRLIVCAVIVVVALAVAVAAFGAAARSGTGMSGERRDAVQAATRDAVQDLMTFAPSIPNADRERVAARLTGRLAAEYRSRGPDVVLPGARTLNVTMTAKVVGVGVRTAGGDDGGGRGADAGVRRPDGVGARTYRGRWRTKLYRQVGLYA